MEINDALVTAITRELLKRLESGECNLDDNKSGESCKKVCETISPVTGKRKVISEADMMKLCPASAGTGQSVVIGIKDIVTPLAEDYIAKMSITVKRA